MKHTMPILLVPGAIGLALALNLTSAAASEHCFRNLGKKRSFGSDLQLVTPQSLAQRDCPIVGFTFTLREPAIRQTLVLADLKKGEMIRMKVDPVSRSWEKWVGFTREELLADDPRDGFDTGQFIASRANQPPDLSDDMLTFISHYKLHQFTGRLSLNADLSQ